MSISLMNSLFTSSRDKNITLLVKKIAERFKVLGSREVLDASGLIFPVFKLLGVNTIRVENRAIPFLDTNAFCSCSLK